MPASQPLIAQLKRHEGFSRKVYQCTAGKDTIGYGRNLDDVGITKAEAEVLLINDIDQAKKQLVSAFPAAASMDPIRQAVLINMVFNLGIAGFLKFRRLRASVEDKAYEQAAKDMLNSAWAAQVGERARELANQMRTGVFLEDIAHG